MKKKGESWEAFYWRTNPSPLEKALFLCIADNCDLVMDYHGTQFRKATYDDARSVREIGYLPTYCPKHQRLYDYLKSQQEKDQEGEG